MGNKRAASRIQESGTETYNREPALGNRRRKEAHDPWGFLIDPGGKGMLEKG